MSAPTYTAKEALPLFVHYFKRAACQRIEVECRGGAVYTKRGNHLAQLPTQEEAESVVAEARAIATADLADIDHEIAKAEFWEKGWKRLVHLCWQRLGAGHPISSRVGKRFLEAGIRSTNARAIRQQRALEVARE